MAFSIKSVPSLCSLIIRVTRFLIVQNTPAADDVGKDHTARKKGELDEFPFTMHYLCVFIAALSGHAHILFDDPRDRVFARRPYDALDFFSVIEKNQRGNSLDTVPLCAGGVVVNV